MIGLVQRVASARVTVEGAIGAEVVGGKVVGGKVVGEIGRGLLVFVCAVPGDDERVASAFVDKVLKLRVFADDAGKMNRSVVDAVGGLLIISQFTLAADTRGGNRPSFTGAAPPEVGRALYETVLRLARERHGSVAAGVFGAHMQVALVNDGPVTIPLDVR